MREFRGWSCLTWGIREGFSEEVALDEDVAKWSTEEGPSMHSDPQGSTELVLNEDQREARLVCGSEEGKDTDEVEGAGASLCRTLKATENRADFIQRAVGSHGGV